MSDLGDLTNFMKFNFKDSWAKLKKNPERIFLGAIDPASSWAWGKITGKKYEPVINQLGSPQGGGGLGLSKNGGEYQKAEDAGIRVKPAKNFFTIGDTIAGFEGGSALGGLLGGGSSAAASGGSAAGSTSGATAGSSGGLLGAGEGASSSIPEIVITGSNSAGAAAGAAGAAGGAAGAASGGSSGGADSLDVGNSTDAIDQAANTTPTVSSDGGGFNWQSLLKQASGMSSQQGGQQQQPYQPPPPIQQRAPYSPHTGLLQSQIYGQRDPVTNLLRINDPNQNTKDQRLLSILGGAGLLGNGNG